MTTTRALPSAVLLAAVILAPGSAAQTYNTIPDRASPNAYPPPLPPREGPAPPRLAFEQLTEVVLPGPLPGDPVSLDDGTIRVPVAGGWARITLDPEPSVELSSDPPADVPADGQSEGWVVSKDGRFRYRTLPEGRVVAQRRRGKRWRQQWSLRAPNATLAPPLIAGERLLFGSLDDRVYAVRRDNGHRLWAVDLGDRISRPLTLWDAELRVPGKPVVPLRVLLVVPDGGGSLIALDVEDGSRLASLEPPFQDSHLIAPALVAPDGRILAAIQKYTPKDAALGVFRLGVPASAKPPRPEVAYNGPELSEDGTPDSAGDRGRAGS